MDDRKGMDWILGTNPSPLTLSIVQHLFHKFCRTDAIWGLCQIFTFLYLVKIISLLSDSDW